MIVCFPNCSLRKLLSSSKPGIHLALKHLFEIMGGMLPAIIGGDYGQHRGIKSIIKQKSNFLIARLPVRLESQFIIRDARTIQI